MNNDQQSGEYKTPNISPNEPFKQESQQLDFQIVDFWKWCMSDLVENRNRGILAEFLVMKALGISSHTRLEWDTYDFQTADEIKIEVKSAAYLQAWNQEKFSTIQFDIAPKRKLLKNNSYATEEKRHADVYVFCLLEHKVLDTVNPMNLDQWSFYIVPTQILDEKLQDQKSVALSTLEWMGFEKCLFGELPDKFDAEMRK